MTPDTRLSITKNTAIEYSHTQRFKSRKKNVFECQATSRDSRQCLASAVSVLICSGAFGRMRKNSTSPSNYFHCTHSLTLWDAKDASPPVRVPSHLCIITFTIYLSTVTEMRECQVCYCSIMRWKKCERQHGDGITWALPISNFRRRVLSITRLSDTFYQGAQNYPTPASFNIYCTMKALANWKS